jgi:hypothetical protein
MHHCISDMYEAYEMFALGKRCETYRHIVLVESGV